MPSSEASSLPCRLLEMLYFHAFDGRLHQESGLGNNLDVFHVEWQNHYHFAFEKYIRKYTLRPMVYQLSFWNQNLIHITSLLFFEPTITCVYRRQPKDVEYLGMRVNEFDTVKPSVPGINMPSI